jgi:phosphoribosyl 1,2-cyclic phosphodiesterase
VTGNPAFTVTFWGVRGSIACPEPEMLRYGGNTSCLEVRCGPHLLIFDAGTGLRPLGRKLAAEGRLDADLFLSHTHFDHVSGLPFFGPVFQPTNRFRFLAGHLKTQGLELCDVLCELMMPPLFPVPIEVFKADIAYKDFVAGAVLAPRPGVTLRTAPLNHPNGATGYRIEHADKAICYVTDTEHTGLGPDPRIVALIAGADLVIYDATYTDEEYPQFKGWGHSTWEEGVRVCEAAGAKRLVIFHHDPGHDDRFMDGIAEAAEKRRPGTLVAREGMTLVP